MAQTRKKSTGRSTSAGRKSTKGRTSQKRKSEPMDVAIRNEILLIVLFAVAVFLFLCNFGIAGVLRSEEHTSELQSQR